MMDIHIQEHHLQLVVHTLCLLVKHIDIERDDEYDAKNQIFEERIVLSGGI